MIRGNFLNAIQREELEQIARRPSEPHGVARRANAILLLDDGWSCAAAARALYLDDDTVRTWHKHYMWGGFDELETFDWKGAKPYLTRDQEAELTDFLDQNMHRDSNEIRAHIAKEYSQWYSRSGCIKLMDRLGFEYKKPRRLPARADEEKQREFIENYEKLLASLSDDEVIYFVDAVHPEHQSKPAFGWIKKGRKVALKSSTGRRRVNIHGALNLENFHCPIVEAERINADSTIALLNKIEAQNRAKTAIYVFFDNARYHHARAVKKWLKRTNSRIKPIFLPAYAPHLNPIERLWGVMHEYVTHNSFYSTYNAFAEAIIAFFKQTVPRDWFQFRDRVTDNFRIISFQDFRVLE